MAKRGMVSYKSAQRLRDTCLCLHVQQAARALARRFDEVLRPFDLTNGQFSLLMALNRQQPPSMGDVASVLAIDRTTLTAALKPLQRRGLVQIMPGPSDKRSRHIALAPRGAVLLARAFPVWRAHHRALEKRLGINAQCLRDDLRAITQQPDRRAASKAL